MKPLLSAAAIAFALHQYDQGEIPGIALAVFLIIVLFFLAEEPLSPCCHKPMYYWDSGWGSRKDERRCSRCDGRCH